MTETVMNVIDVILVKSNKRRKRNQLAPKKASYFPTQKKKNKSGDKKIP